MKVKIGTLKKLLREAFSQKDLDNATLRYRKPITPNLKGNMARYVSAIEMLLLRAGKSTSLTGADLKKAMDQGMLPTAAPGDVTMMPDVPADPDDVSGLFPGQLSGPQGAAPQTPPPSPLPPPTGAPSSPAPGAAPGAGAPIPPLSKLAKDATKAKTKKK